MNTTAIKWSVKRVGSTRSGKLFLYEDDCQVAQLKYDHNYKFGCLVIAKWFTTRSIEKFDTFCNALSVSETLEILAEGI